MAASDRPSQAAQAGAAGSAPAGPRGAGWVLFAGIMLLLLGIMNIVYGLAAIDGSRFYAQDVTYILSGLNTWGWVLLIAGVVQTLGAFGIWTGAEWARWVGLVSASANVLFQLMFIAAFPLASMVLIGIGILVIYGLAAYGGKRYREAY
jgi:hypothetical protein